MRFRETGILQEKGLASRKTTIFPPLLSSRSKSENECEYEYKNTSFAIGRDFS